MRVGDVKASDFAAELTDSGIPIRCGPFVTNIVTTLANLAEPIRFLYDAFPIIRDTLVDFHVQLRGASGFFNQFRPKIEFSLDNRPFLSLPRRLALPLLEWGLNWCVYANAHQYFIIHAAAVQKGRATCILPGTSGSGKSTLTAALVSCGWRLLTDELAIIRLSDGQVLPLARPVSLKNESIDLIRAFAPDQCFGPLIRETPKGFMAHMKPPPDSVRRMNEAAAPNQIIFPSFSRGKDAVLSPCPKGRAFFRVAESSPNYGILGRDGFRVLADSVENCDCYEFSYSSLNDAVRTFDEFV